MMKAATMALLTVEEEMPRKSGSFSNLATKPKVVVTPVEIRHSSSQIPYITVSQPIPISRQEVSVGMTEPPATDV